MSDNINEYLQFQKCIEFIRKLKNKTEGNDFTPLSYIYDDEFRLLEKFVRRGYYGR